MKAHSNWEEFPIVETVQVLPSEFGPEYLALHNKRESYNSLKKSLSSLSPIIAAILENEKQQKAVSMVAIPEHDEAVPMESKLLTKLRADRLDLLVAIEVQVPLFEASPYAEALNEVLLHARVVKMSFDQHQKYMEVSKMLTQKLFGDQNKLMQEMKKSKKVFLDMSK